MDIQQQVSLKPYNTFGMDVRAAFFTAFHSVEELTEALSYKKAQDIPVLILGGGSNILFTKDVNALVLHNKIKGIERIADNEREVLVKAGAGEVWHDLVCWCIEHNYAGIENLSLIPGNVGAAPIQNIGAYGVELKDVFTELEAIDIQSGTIRKFNSDDCHFGYRNSIFKNEFKGRYIILSVTLRLKKEAVFHTSYGAIEKELERMQISTLHIKTISQAVINIRTSKLPDPKQLGNAGSFFKNPVIPTKQFTKLQEQYPGIVGYKVNEERTKVAAGWLIEQDGWKGQRRENIGVHNKQALVLVNYGEAEGAKIAQLAYDIRHSVKDRFGIELEPEVNIL